MFGARGAPHALGNHPDDSRLKSSSKLKINTVKINVDNRAGTYLNINNGVPFEGNTENTKSFAEPKIVLIIIYIVTVVHEKASDHAGVSSKCDATDVCATLDARNGNHIPEGLNGSSNGSTDL